MNTSGKKNFFLHIGTHKTGSTAIQCALKEHKDFLLKKRFFPVVLHTDWPDVHKVFNPWFHGLKPEDVDVAGVKKAFVEKAEAIKEDNIVISCEDLTAFYRPWTDKAKKLQFLIQDICSDVTVIVYLRRQDTMYESGYQEQKKSGHIALEFGEYLKDEHSTPYEAHLDWFAKIRDYQKHLPGAKFIPRIYELVVNKGDILVDFLKAIGIRKVPGKLRSEYVNQGLPDAALTILSGCRGYLSPEEYQKLREILSRWAKEKYPLTMPKYNYFSLDERIRLVDYYHESNQQLFHEFKLGTEDDLSNWERIDTDRSCIDQENPYVLLSKLILDKV